MLYEQKERRTLSLEALSIAAVLWNIVNVPMV